MFLSPMDSFSVVPMCLSFQLSWSKSLLAMDRFDFFMERFSVRHGADACLTASFQKFTASFPNLTAAFCELTAAFFRWSASPFALFALSCRNVPALSQNHHLIRGQSPAVPDGLVAAWDAVPQLREAHWRARIVAGAPSCPPRSRRTRRALEFIEVLGLGFLRQRERIDVYSRAAVEEIA